MSITVKRIPNGEYSRKLTDTLQVGDELITIGTAGFFILPEKMGDISDLVFLAAGSGITPIYSLIKTVLTEAPYKRILLIYSNRTKEDTIFLNSLLLLQQQNSHRFYIQFLYSDSVNIARARLSNIWLETILYQQGINDFKNTLFYTCGPFDYMLMVTITLRSLGVPAAHIRKENFSTYKPELEKEPPDRDLHRVTLLHGDKTHFLEVQYPVTILQKARQSGLHLPYSCEAGRCGTCVARCEKGKVWMSNNEVLLEEEIEKGLILTCTGYPSGGDVLIQI